MTKPEIEEVRSAPERSLRRDAELNRQRIIQAAREVFAAQGLSAGLNDIAHHAGVGVGTVYRRFPDKDALIEAALSDQIDLLLGVAEEALTAERAWDGLLGLLERGLALLVVNLGLRDLSVGATEDPHLRAAAERRFIPYVQQLLQRAQAEGDLREDVTVEDFFVLECMISELARHSIDLRPQAWRRYLQIMTDGLRAERSATLYGPLDSATASTITRRWIGTA